MTSHERMTYIRALLTFLALNKKLKMYFKQNIVYFWFLCRRVDALGQIVIYLRNPQ